MTKVTRRCLAIGLGMAAWVNFWPVYASLVLHSTRADHAHLPVAMLIPYLFLLVGNAFLKRHRLSSSELMTVCCMGMVAACMQGNGCRTIFSKHSRCRAISRPQRTAGTNCCCRICRVGPRYMTALQ